MQHIHNAAKLALDRYRAATVERTDTLVTTLHELLLAHEAERSVEERLSAMEAVIGSRADELLEACEAHLVHAGSNQFPFVWRTYKSHRERVDPVPLGLRRAWRRLAGPAMRRSRLGHARRR
jgi:hypothetical protein